MKSIIIHEFMIKELKLKGFELLTYAVIYSFSSFGSICYISDKVFCQFLGCSRSQFYKCRSSLLYKNLIQIKGLGFITEAYVPEKIEEEDLDELIRIAKTPWLDDKVSKSD